MTLGGSGTRAPHLPSLTSLRFFAAAFVLVHHAFGPDNIPVVDLGFLGVTFFFALSGFLLTWAGSADRGPLHCYRNRFARIYPLHIATLLVALALPYGKADSPQTFFQNVLLLQAWTPDGAHSFNWVSWSISAEAFFYLVFPLVIFLLQGRSPRTLALTAAGAWIVPVVLTAVLNRAIPEHAFFLTYDFPPFRFGEFLTGACLALWMLRAGRPSPQVLRLATYAAGSLVVVILATDILHPIGRSYYSALFLPVVMVVLYACATRDVSGYRGLLHHRWLVTLGKWSFALYMVHMLAIRAVAFFIGQDEPAYLPVWAALISIAASIALSGAAYEFIEKPLERRLRGDKRLPAALSA